MNLKIKKFKLVSAMLLIFSLPTTVLAAEAEPGQGLTIPVVPEGPLYYDTAEGFDIKVNVLARGLNHPWSIVFLPDGSALITEKNAGQIRHIVNDQLLEEPVLGVPEVLAGKYSGLLDIALDPDFEKTPYIYLSYNKPLPGGETAIAFARGLWDGKNLIDTNDIFVASAGTTSGSHILFDDDGMMYVSIYVNVGDEKSLATDSQKGKILRLTKEGKIPHDNPFIGNAKFLPEIYSYGHRTVTGLTLHPQTREMWATEMGPNGGDEVNLIEAGNNYGWPMVSLGRTYTGPWQSDVFQQEGMVDPVAYWMPSISVSGISFYDGDVFPQWQGNLFVGGMRVGQIPGTGILQRIVFNEDMEEIRREALFADLRQRIRDVIQGPDGFIYVLTDEDDGVVLRIEPAN